jgi:hypothetical protein
MCYQIPGAITKDGNPILGGLDIDEQDYTFMSSIYPKPEVHADPARISSDATVRELREERDALKKALASTSTIPSTSLRVAVKHASLRPSLVT